MPSSRTAPVLDLPQRCRAHLAVQATHRPRVRAAGEFLDDVTEEARHSDRGRIDRTDQPARLDDRLSGEILILQERQSSAIIRPRHHPHLPRPDPIGAPVPAG
jgi:hypothetical protein